MNKKVSNITYEDLARYLRINEIDNIEKKELETLLNVAISYIESFTGIQRYSESNIQNETLDSHDDLVIVVYILVQDMYDNRKMYVEGKNVNLTVNTILNMHVRNYL